MFEELSTKYTPLASRGNAPLLSALLTVVRKLVSVKLVVVFTKVWPPNVTLPLTLPEASPYVVAMCSIGVPLRELMKCSTRLTVAAVLEPVLAQLPYQIM